MEALEVALHFSELIAKHLGVSKGPVNVREMLVYVRLLRSKRGILHFKIDKLSKN